MSNKAKKNQINTRSKPTKNNNELHKPKTTNPTKITNCKKMKKNSKQTSKPHRPITTKKITEAINRSITAKKPSIKENINRPAINKSNTLKKQRPKSVNNNNNDKKVIIAKKSSNPIIQSSLAKSDARYDPAKLQPLAKAKSQPNIEPILRTKSINNPDSKTQEGRKKIAKETLKIIYGPNSSRYFIPKTNEVVDLTDKIKNCVEKTETIINVRYDTWTEPTIREPFCVIEVTPESPFGAAKRLSQMYKTVVLNFASATKPGGVFLTGKSEQEENLSRQSALFKSIQKEKFMYMHHKINRARDFKYSDYMIYSPDVPVFRDDKCEKLLPEKDVFCTDVISATAPNKTQMVKNGQNTDGVYNALYIRCEKILRCAIDHGAKAIVLGPFGCGAFGNDPKDVSKIFKHLLVVKDYRKYFKSVVFAIVDKNSTNFKEFKATFK